MINAFGSRNFVLVTCVYLSRTVFYFVMEGHVFARFLMHLNLNISINACQFAVNTASLAASN
jgi:hypothetical protein